MVRTSNFNNWFFEKIGEKVKGKEHKQQDNWWNVMCLTGVDYFSSLGFAPGMAFLAAGLLSPFATFLLVLLNIFGAYPMYAKVAERSPHGQGSIAILEDLLPSWWGKLLVLFLLGFATTDFMMTITLCASDAAKHVVDNPLSPSWLQNQIALTLILVATLGAVFLKGFKDAIGLSIILVWAYLSMTAYLIVVCCTQIFHNPQLLSNWQSGIFQMHGSWWQIAAVSALAFPKLALGMSGFETGVAVMPLVKGEPSDSPDIPLGRIKNTKKLLLCAAVLMGFYLVASSLVTTVLIPASEFAEGGKANGRALAYLAHELLGNGFGTAYDISTLLILWFAGASAMAGMLNLIPRYLPRYGMAPEWVSALRPLVLLLTAIAFFVVWAFKADVDAQGGAFATGLLVLMTSAAYAATLAVWKEKTLQKYLFSVIALTFTYTTINNIISRPDGIKVASLFIAAIVLLSFVSRFSRSTELRVGKVILDKKAQEFIETACSKHLGEIRILAHRPGGTNYREKETEARENHSIQSGEGNFIFLEITPLEVSDFWEDSLEVQGLEIDGYNILRCSSSGVPNGIAALLLHIRNTTGKIPHAYFGWTEGNPIAYVLRYVFFGEGETAPLAREILRNAEHDDSLRPIIHVS
ncbi:MAG: amino acid transporter [Leptolyngbya sp.]|nr:amino acid transporter [Candidatus Melainabacteria bacterium]